MMLPNVKDALNLLSSAERRLCYSWEKARREERIKALACNDCGRKWCNPYMVHKRVWAEAGFFSYKGMCCLRCIQRRLKRSLRIDDFTPAAINDPIRLGYMIGFLEGQGVTL